MKDADTESATGSQAPMSTINWYKSGWPEGIEAERMLNVLRK